MHYTGDRPPSRAVQLPPWPPSTGSATLWTPLWLGRGLVILHQHLFGWEGRGRPEPSRSQSTDGSALLLSSWLCVAPKPTTLISNSAGTDRLSRPQAPVPDVSANMCTLHGSSPTHFTTSEGSSLLLLVKGIQWQVSHLDCFYKRVNHQLATAELIVKKISLCTWNCMLGNRNCTSLERQKKTPLCVRP